MWVGLEARARSHKLNATPGRFTGEAPMTMTEPKVIKAKFGLLELPKSRPS